MKEVRVEVDALLAGIEDGEFLTVEDPLVRVSEEMTAVISSFVGRGLRGCR